VHGACVSLTPHAKYDTACTIEERFVRPWQPSKGISIKNCMYANWPKRPLQKYVNLKGLPNENFVHAYARFLRPKIDHISANSKQNSKRLRPVNQGPQMYCLIKKNPRSQIS
jgi:hypothetical protein